jgi:hypothetical protein
MNTIISNTKKIVIALGVAVMAIGFSSFTEMRENMPAKAKKAGMITANYLVQPSLNSFAQLGSGTPNNADCKSTSTLNCSYDVTDDGKDNIPDQGSYTATEINTYVANGWLSAHAGSGQRIYQP